MSGVVQNSPSTHQEFSTFAYWREPIIEIRMEKEMSKEEKKGEEKSKVSEKEKSPTMADVVVAAVAEKEKALKKAENAKS